MYRLFLFLLAFGCSPLLWAQTGRISGIVWAGDQPVSGATVVLSGTAFSTHTDSMGTYLLDSIPEGRYTLLVRMLKYGTTSRTLTVRANTQLTEDVDLSRTSQGLDEVVISGTLKPVSRSESPVPVEVYSSAYFKKNPTANIFEALQNVNGVRPQLNCNVCNTGDIHINGLEGPYTLVLIDGMPIVSALSTVYGLSGIPNSLIDRIEVVKGPASSLYGSEAVGGLINIITKTPQKAPRVSADVFGTTYGEYNADIGLKWKAGKNATVLSGINYFNYQQPVDRNGDGFTDVTLQNRISLFQKWDLARADHRVFSLAGRYLYEDRWGGDMRWNKTYRGGSEIYGESIYTSRWELIGKYQLPTREHLMLWGSFNQHEQDSRYGATSYIASQRIAFGQLLWRKTLGKNELLTGLALRYTYYDDNTPATATAEPGASQNAPSRTWLPGVFVQDEIKLAPNHDVLLGLRYDYNSFHGSIFTPRLAYKWAINPENIIRLNLGTGYRVVNLFTEDHAALTGARQVVIRNALRPERSYNANLNYIRKFVTGFGFIGLDASAFYTYFNNRIVGDYDTDPNQIIYDNLSGHAESRGLTLNADASFTNGLKIILGGTLMDVSLTENGVRRSQILTEHFTGTWAITYPIRKLHLSLDYTGNVYSPMRLPLLSPLDPRPEYSPWWSIQNIQITYNGFRNLELYGGVKNLLNWTPARTAPFLIARSHDPFDQQVQLGADGQVQATPGNPYALTFDPNYVYAPNQGIRGFIGARLTLN
jgi:outer membrane receptor for ferrienterochelin and colicins